MSDKIEGRNPVMEALKSGREIEKIMIAKGTEGGLVDQNHRKSEGQRDTDSVCRKTEVK